MAETTGISWADGTHNWWEGCQETGSPACVGCYAKARNARFGGGTAPNWGPGAPRRLMSHATRTKVRAWNARPEMLKSTPPGTKPFIFGGSLMDFADNAVDPAWREEQFLEYGAAENLVFLMLTKRIGNVMKMVGEVMNANLSLVGWSPNMALGITVVTQAEADRDIPKLLETVRRLRLAGMAPAFIFLSIEPMAGPMVLRPEWLAELGWVIVGGCSDQAGHPAFPSHPDWFRAIRDACAAAGVPFHFKQWGEWREAQTGDEFDTSKGGAGKPPAFIVDPEDGTVHCFMPAKPNPRYRVMVKVGKKAAGRLLDGVTHDARPVVAA
jgi:protein gp37